MSDFMQEIRLSYEGYHCWQEIKNEIKFKMETCNEKVILYAFSSSAVAEEIINFLNKNEFEVISGEKVWNNFPKCYDKVGFNHYCNYTFDMSNDNPKLIKFNHPKIPCIIKW